MELRESIKTTLRKYLNEQQQIKEAMNNNLMLKYPNVKFSSKFFNKEENMIKYQHDLYLEKIDTFIDFYKNYQPKGHRIFNGRDVYEESKLIYDKVVNGEVYIDDVFTNPDNPLRNIVMLLHIDEPALKKRMNENISILEIIKENKNFIYTTSDYKRYISLEKEILTKLNEISPSDFFFVSTWYRRADENDKDLIFQEMHFPSKSNSSVKKLPFGKTEKLNITNSINNIINIYGVKSVKILFDDKGRGITLLNLKDSKIKKADKGRKSFEYPINNKKIKFIISDRDLVPFTGIKSLKHIFSDSESLTIDGAYRVVSYLSTHLYKFIKIDDDIFNLNDVEKSYVKFFQDTKDIETDDNVGTKDIMFKRYILNELKIYNNHKDINNLFDMLETINFDFVYYDSINPLSATHYVRNL